MRKYKDPFKLDAKNMVFLVDMKEIIKKIPQLNNEIKIALFLLRFLSIQVVANFEVPRVVHIGRRGAQAPYDVIMATPGGDMKQQWTCA